MDWRGYDQKRHKNNVDPYRPLKLVIVTILGVALILIMVNMEATSEFVLRILEKIRQ
jgi:hypothetical protein